MNVVIIKRDAMTVSFTAETQDNVERELARMIADSFYNIHWSDPVFVGDKHGRMEFTAGELVNEFERKRLARERA